MKVLVLNPPVKGVKFSRDGRCQSEENTWLDTFPPTALISIAGAVREKYNTKLIDCMGADIDYDSCLEITKDIDIVVVRENTEGLYAGIEFEEGKPETKKIIKDIQKLTKSKIRDDSGISLKPISAEHYTL